MNRASDHEFKSEEPSKTSLKREKPEKSFSVAVKKAILQMKMMFPPLVGVILLVGLFQTYVPKALISSLFMGKPLLDAMFGAFIGSVLAGNPVNSYVIGKGLLDIGVGLVGVSSFILTWVTVGLVQFPAEAAALGFRFAFVRAISAFVLAIPTACLTSWLVRMI